MKTNFNKIFKDRKVLVTGHTGFKGSWLTLWLTKLGAKVAGVSIEPPTDPNLFEILRLKEKINHFFCDIRDAAALRKIFEQEQPEIVFHLAAQPLVRISYAEPKLTYETNIMGTINVFEAVRSTPSVRAVVNVTSDKCYENKDYFTAFKETDAVGGHDPYSSSKGCAELITAAYRNSYFAGSGVVLASARAGNVIGGGDWACDRLIPDCMKSIMSGKSVLIRSPLAIRPWQHVLEPLSGYLLLGQMLIEHGQKFAEGWNFGPHNEDAKPVQFLVNRLCEKWGQNSKYSIDSNKHPKEAICLMLDCSKARFELGWNPKWNIETALDKVVEWFKCYERGENIEGICLKQIGEYSEEK